MQAWAAYSQSRRAGLQCQAIERPIGEASLQGTYDFELVMTPAAVAIPKASAGIGVGHELN